VNAKVVAVTQPLVEKDGVKLTAEEFIVYAARVSNPSNQLNTETAGKLLKYCITHGHWSIFEQSSMTVEIKTSRAISAQILRHRSFCFQEFSQRYAVSTEFEDIELRTQDPKNRQASGETIDDLEMDEAVREHVWRSNKLYSYLLSKGASKETARMVLPLCTQTTLYMTGSVRSWIHCFDQRCASGIQKEHRLLALKIRDECFKQHFPIIHDLITNQR
jgi:thymidylate synthase (FAD)